jgi:hypothetical protein
LGVPHIFGRKLLAALSPRRLFTARLFYSAGQRGDAGRRGFGWRCECVMRIDIPAFKP